MPSHSQFTRIDTQELKAQIFRKIGRQKAEKYFFNLKRLLDLKLSKMEFDKSVHLTMGKENFALHNLFIKSILTNACLSHGPPSKQTTTSHSQSTRISCGNFGEIIPLSPRKGRSVNSRDRRFADRPSPLGPHGKIPNGNVQEVTNSCDISRSREQQGVQELISVGSKVLLEVGSVEDGEEVEQDRGSPGVQSRSPVRAPLGLSFGSCPRKSLFNEPASVFSLSKPNPNAVETCSMSYELPDTRALRKRLEAKMESQGLGISLDSVNLLNNGLDAYLKRLIKPYMDLARSRCGNDKLNQANGKFNHNTSGLWHEEHVQRAQQFHLASSVDFQVAMETNPQLLGGDWPVQLEMITGFMRENK